MTKLQQLCKELESEIERTYTDGVTLEEAEKLAAKFLGAQIKVSEALKIAGLDAKMRKAGAKAVRAAIYLSEVQKNDKKPSDVLLNATVETNEVVAAEETELFKSEESKEELNRYYDIFHEAHVYYRGVAKSNNG